MNYSTMPENPVIPEPEYPDHVIEGKNFSLNLTQGTLLTYELSKEPGHEDEIVSASYCDNVKITGYNSDEENSDVLECENVSFTVSKVE